MLPSMIVGSSSPAGDTPDRTGYRDPIMEKQMADAKKIPDTANPDTLPNEALKVIQEDADMTNTDLDPEAGFISQADIDANQQMGSPTSQGFMSKYGENDQDLLQTT